MPRIYRVPYTGTLTNAGGDADLVIIQPASNKPCRLVGMRLCQSSEIGDAQEENLRITLRRMTATVTVTGGTGVTPVANDTTGAAASFTATANCTTVATTSGTSTIMEEMAWNERASPAEFWWPERDLQPRVINGEALIVRNESTAADDLTIEVTFFVEEE